MKTRIALLLAGALSVPWWAGSAQESGGAADTNPAPAAAQPPPADPAGEDIEISVNGSAVEVIKFLGEYAQVRLQLDPQVEKGLDAAGNPMPGWNEPKTLRWTNVTAEQALLDFLGRHQLTIAKGDGADSYRVVHGSGAKVAAAPAAAEKPAAEKPAEEKPAVEAAAAPAMTPPPAAEPAATTPFDPEQTTPVRVEEQTVVEAIGSLARNARLNYQLDPRIIQGFDSENKPSAILTNAISVRWENVRPRAALEAFLANYNMILLEQTNTGVYRVTYKLPVPPEPPVTRAYTLKHAVATNLVAVISNTIPTAKVFADQRTSQLLVTALERDQTTVSNLLLRLDSSLRQILIAAQFWETAKNPTSVKGIDWTKTLEAQNFQFGNGLTTVNSATTRPGQGGTVTLPSGRQVESSSGSKTTSSEETSVSSVSPLPSLPTSVPGISANTLSGFSPATAFLSADGVRATLSFLNTDSDTESIATPRAVTLDGQPADLSVVRNIPVFEEQQGSQNQGVVQPNTVKPNYDLKVGQDILNAVGIRLIVTPHVVGDTNVLLDLKPEISSVEAEMAKATLGGRENTAPIFARRRVNTQAVVPDGTTLVLGGLNNSEKTVTYTKVPILGDIPVIGLAFRKDAKSRNKRNLLLFVTPTIIRDSDYQPETRDAEFMRKSRASDVEDKTSAWDSGRPYDWKAGLEPANK